VHDAVKSAVCRNISCLIYWPVALTTKDEMFTRLRSYDYDGSCAASWWNFDRWQQDTSKFCWLAE